jgi:hypothetical protein
MNWDFSLKLCGQIATAIVCKLLLLRKPVKKQHVQQTKEKFDSSAANLVRTSK